MTTGTQPALDRYDRVRGTIAPVRTDDLKPGVADWIGRRCEFVVAWEVDDGPYAGDWAMMLWGEHDAKPPFAWMPLCDLADVEIVAPPT